MIGGKPGWPHEQRRFGTWSCGGTPSAQSPDGHDGVGVRLFRPEGLHYTIGLLISLHQNGNDAGIVKPAESVDCSVAKNDAAVACRDVREQFEDTILVFRGATVTEWFLEPVQGFGPLVAGARWIGEQYDQRIFGNNRVAYCFERLFAETPAGHRVPHMSATGCRK